MDDESITIDQGQFNALIAAAKAGQDLTEEIMEGGTHQSWKRLFNALASLRATGIALE